MKTPHFYPVAGLKGNEHGERRHSKALSHSTNAIAPTSGRMAMLFAAVHESEIGTFRTQLDV